MKYSNRPICPSDGERLALKVDATGGVNTSTTGDLHATCPECGRRWVQRMMLDWREVPIEIVQGQSWMHRVSRREATVERIGIPRVLLSNGERQWWISREALRKNYRLIDGAS